METVELFIEHVGAETDTRKVTRDPHIRAFIEKLKESGKPVTALKASVRMLKLRRS